MDTYKAVKTQYDELKLRLLELEAVKEQARRAWHNAEHDDKKTYKELRDADNNAYDMRKSVKAVAYKLVALEHKELGTSLNKLFREYGISTSTIRRLLKEAGVVYFRPTMVQWFPIVTAPRDGTEVILCKIMDFYKSSDPINEKYDFAIAGWDQDDWMIYSSDDVIFHDPTHWMPLPEPPVLEEKKDD